MSKTPVMWFKMDKYHRMGNKYMVAMKDIVTTLFDIPSVEGIEFNILYSDCEQTCNKPMSKEQILEALNIIYTIENSKISMNL